MDTKKILIVEDEAIPAAFLKHMLEQNGFAVTGIAGRGKTAIDMATEYRPEIILMDINLIGSMNGIEAAIQIREIYEPAIIFMTGYEQQDYRTKAAGLNPLAYLTKPVDFVQLKEYLG